MLPLVLTDLEDRHDARMVEIGGRLGLGVEAFDVVLIGELAGQDHLEGDNAVEADLPGLKDDAHAAAGDLPDNLIVAKVADALARCRLAVVVGLAASRDRRDGRQVVLRSCRRRSCRGRAEGGVDWHGMLREAARVFLSARLLAGAAAQLDLDSEQFFEQRGLRDSSTSSR